MTHEADPDHPTQKNTRGVAALKAEVKLLRKCLTLLIKAARTGNGSLKIVKDAEKALGDE